MRLVLDTNVLVSALFWNGKERRLLAACMDGRHEITISPPLLAEAERVLLEKFDYPKADAAAYLRSIARMATIVDPKERLTIVKEDPSDDRVLECAVAGGADRIVTGDRHLLKLKAFRGIVIVRAADL